jgi:diguanylate cyclase (GGDEF)-like protein/PAS domain S-box-containing protein
LTQAAESWSTHQLTEFLDLVHTFSDEGVAMRRAAERAGEALDAEVAAVVSRGKVEVAIGFPRHQIPVSALLAVATSQRDAIEVPGLGSCASFSVPVESLADGWLVVARQGAWDFTREELSLLRGMARVLAMAVRMLRGVVEERELRERSQQEVLVRKQAEANYRNLVERLPAIVYTAEMGERGVWRYVSPQIEEILGFSPAEWMADPGLWAKQLHPDDRERALAPENPALWEQRDPPPIDYRMLTRDGRAVWFLDEAVLEIGQTGAAMWHGILYDITDRKQAEEELERRAAQQAAVASLGERALEGDDLATLMEMAVSVVAKLERLDCCGVMQVVPGGESLLLRAGAGWPDGAVGNLRMATGSTTPAGLALESGKHVLVEDWSTEKRFKSHPMLDRMDVRGGISVVIEGSNGAFGVLDGHSTEARPFAPEDVHFVQAVANVLADAIARSVADEAMRDRALHDPLTGLPNRVLFIDRLAHSLAQARRRGTSVAVLFLDLDHFKLINDSLGHQVGDELLTAVAPRLNQQVRPSDTVARFGGDEFGILIDEVDDERDAIRVTERIQAAFTRPFVLNHVEHFVSASVGIALASTGNEPPDSLIRDADAAMYRAKERGRARYELFDQLMRARAVERLEVENELRRAIERSELVLHYQPVVSLATGAIIGVEGLLRWRHPQRGLIPPGEFIPIAEESGLIEPIGRWVLEEASRQVVEWHRARPDARPIEISVNLAARQVAQRDLADVVLGVLRGTGLDPGLLSLEITESVLIEESGLPIETLRSLKALGVQIVLDDFGTGYSSLGYLNTFPVDALKIDRSFVNGLDSQRENAAIVEAIVGMARALSLQVVAEGVETEVQLTELKRLGCDSAQGFYFAKPLPAAEMGELLMGNTALVRREQE